jgi:hypothetical protein
MVVFSGLNTVADMRNASRQGKAKKATDKMATSTSTAAPAGEKPVTNTSGTAKSAKNDGNMKQTMQQIAFGQKMGGGMGAVAGFLGMPFTKRIGGQVMTVDTRNQDVLTPGVPMKANKNATIGGFGTNVSKKKASNSNGTGIDAPAPDTGWRPSGINSALGLQSAEMGVPLQETVGVSKRKR